LYYESVGCVYSTYSTFFLCLMFMFNVLRTTSIPCVHHVRYMSGLPPCSPGTTEVVLSEYKCKKLLLMSAQIQFGCTTSSSNIQHDTLIQASLDRSMLLLPSKEYTLRRRQMEALLHLHIAPVTNFNSTSTRTL
jgi:hypothetical protein